MDTYHTWNRPCGALAMINVIINENLYDSDFVNNYTSGFDQLSTFIQQYTPEWAAPITGVSADTLTRIAEEFATQKPSVAVLVTWTSEKQGSILEIRSRLVYSQCTCWVYRCSRNHHGNRGASLAYVGPPQTPPAPYPEAIDSREKLLPTPGGVWDGMLTQPDFKILLQIAC